MHTITLVCSAHREHGLCNAVELLKILHATEAEVVFEEIRPADFESYCKLGIRSSVEAQAIAKYLEGRSLRRVPVDRYDMPVASMAGFKQEIDGLFDYVWQTNREYQQLEEQNDANTRQFGYSYLNSDACATAMARLVELEDKTVIDTGDDRLIGALKKWRQLHRSREHEMIRHIYEYCRANPFDTGLFLVGAAHKADVFKEIERIASAETPPISWKCLELSREGVIGA